MATVPNASGSVSSASYTVPFARNCGWTGSRPSSVSTRPRARASIGGGGLPRVNSGRKENGSTVYLEQIHGDAAMALTYAITKNLLFDIGPRLTYFFQREKSHQEDNEFQLIDYGLRAGVTLKF